MQGIETMNSDDPVGKRLGQIIDESVRLAQSAWTMVLLYVCAMTGAGMIADQLSDLGAGNLLFSLLQIVLGYLLTVQLLREGGLISEHARAGFGTYFGLSLLSGLGIVLGLLVLLVPGVMLLVRWAPAYGFVLGEGASISEGLSKSWAQTGAHFWPIALAILLPVGVNLAAGASYFFAFDDQGVLSVPVSAVANLGISCGGAAITAVGIATYALLRDQTDEIASIFQ
jgi:hypothetical protein